MFKKIFTKYAAFAVTAMLIIGVLPKNVSAASLSTSMSGASSISQGEEFTVTFSFSSDSSVAAVSGSLDYDHGKLSVTGVSGSDYFSATLGSSLVADSDGSSASSSGSFARVTFQATSGFGEGESTTITLSGVSGSIVDSEGNPSSTSGSGCSKTVSIPNAPPPENPTTPGGNTTPSTPKSSDNKLSSLSVSGGTSSPQFSSNTASYNLTVDYSVENVTVSASANDSAATVTVDAPSPLVAGENNVVTVAVRAENGSVRTYTINVFRSQDPNYVPSKDATLTEIVPITGNLSPAFDPNVLNYAMDVDYSVTEMTFTAKVNFPRATYSVIGTTQLVTDKDNLFTVLCIAEDGVTVNKYTITVRRALIYSEDILKQQANDIIKHIVSENFTVWDISSMPVQIVPANVFNTLKKYPEHTLKIITKNGAISVKGSDITESIGNKPFDLTINDSSIYESAMISTRASYQTGVFSTHFKGKLPSRVSYCVNTDIAPKSNVYIYLYDDSDNTFYTVATNITVGENGSVCFVFDRGGDFLITDKEIPEANPEFLLEDNTNPDPEKKGYSLYIMGAAVVIAFIIGIAIGIFAAAPKDKGPNGHGGKKEKIKKDKKRKAPAAKDSAMSGNDFFLDEEPAEETDGKDSPKTDPIEALSEHSFFEDEAEKKNDTDNTDEDNEEEKVEPIEGQIALSDVPAEEHEASNTAEDAERSEEDGFFADGLEEIEKILSEKQYSEDEDDKL